MSSTLYQEIILDHYHSPRHYGPLKNATHESDATNPLCGDQLHMQARIVNNTIRDISFTGSGCAISIAAASLLLEKLQGKKVSTVAALKPQAVLDLVGMELTPNRVKCALVSLETLQQLVAKKNAQRRGR